MGRTWSGGTAAAVAIAVVGAACGASDRAHDDARTIAVSVLAEETRAGSTARFEIESRYPAAEVGISVADGAPAVVVLSTSGAVDFETGDAYWQTATTTPDGVEGSGGFVTPYDVRVVGATGYSTLDRATAELFDPAEVAGKRWLQWSDDDGFDPSEFGPDPNALLATLADMEPELTPGRSGREIRGVATEHWETTIGTEEAWDLGIGPWVATDDVELGLWVDDDDRVRRLESRAADAELWVEFFDFGAPVEVTAPPAAEVLDAERLGERFGALNSVGGTWRRVGSGAAAGITWEMWSAPSQVAAATCWSFETDPAVSAGPWSLGTWSEDLSIESVPPDTGAQPPPGLTDDELERARRRFAELAPPGGLPDDSTGADVPPELETGDDPGPDLGWAPASRTPAFQATCSLPPGEDRFGAGAHVVLVGDSAVATGAVTAFAGVVRPDVGALTVRFADGTSEAVPVAEGGFAVWVGPTEHHIEEVLTDDGSVACRWVDFDDMPGDQHPPPDELAADQESALRSGLADDGFAAEQVDELVEWLTEASGPPIDIEIPGIAVGALNCWGL